MKPSDLGAGQVYVLSYGSSSNVFLLLERYLAKGVDGLNEPLWEALRLSDGKTRSVSEEWLLSRDSTRVA